MISGELKEVLEEARALLVEVGQTPLPVQSDDDGALRWNASFARDWRDIEMRAQRCESRIFTLLFEHVEVRPLLGGRW